MNEEKKNLSSGSEHKGYLQQIDEFFDQTPLRGIIAEMNHFFQKGNRLLTFPIDLYEAGNDLVIQAEIPGIRKNQIHIDLEGDFLRISIQDETIKQEENDINNYFRRERSLSEASRAIKLPYRVNKKLAKASYKDGILEIRAPKVAKHGNTLSIE